MSSELRDFARHAAGMRSFLRAPLTEADCVARLRGEVGLRERRFLDTVGRAVFAQPAGPYRRLFLHAGIEEGDLARLVGDEGVDGAVETLYEAGVRVSLDEFRGNRPIERTGLTLPVRESDFDNPLLGSTWHATTGGSRSMGRQVLLNFEHYERQTLYFGLFVTAHGAVGRPQGMWRPFASRTSTSNALQAAKLRRPLEKWFSQTRIAERPFRAREKALAGYALLAARLWASGMPLPEHVPFGEAARIACWLEEKARLGTPALFRAPVGSGTRIAIAARRDGIDIGGTLFRLGGEPLTPARAAVFADAECTAYADYAMAELGRAGVACAAPAAVGDVHVMTDKIAVVQRPRTVPTTGETVGALFFTTLLPSAPKLMINVETDDYAVVEHRSCGCLIGELGFTQHLHGIRSYEKLTSEGMTVRGRDVLTLLEKTLPARFGGSPTDYQFVESPDEALPTLSVLIAPHVGPVDESEVIDVVLATLSRSGPGPAEMTRMWRGGDALRVVRREPHATPAAKVLPIHVLRRETP